MVLKKKTIALILMFFGVLMIIFGAFFGFVASNTKRELEEKVEELKNTIYELQIKNDALDHFYKMYYKLVNPYGFWYNDLEYLKQIISCMAVKANFDLDRSFYKLVKKTLRLHNKYKLVDSCYFSFAGLKFPPSYLKVINRGGKFDVTMEETEKRPTLLKLVTSYLEKMEAVGKKIDEVDAAIADNHKKLNTYLSGGGVADFSSMAKVLRDKDSELASKTIKETDRDKAEKNLKELEEELKKDSADNRILKKYYIMKNKLKSFSEDISELLNRVERYLFGIVEQAYKKEFAGDEILRKKDYSVLCSQMVSGMPQSCVDIVDILCAKKDGKAANVKSFLWIVTELEWPKMAKINELKFTSNLKYRIDRNDTTILEEFKESQEKLPVLAKNIILLRQTKKILQDQVEKIKSKIAKQKIEKKSVGGILSIDRYANKGVINLGRRNGLFNNTVFEVYGVIKGRDFVFKGIAKILKLGEKNSKVLILPVVSVEDKSFVISRGAGIAYPEFFDIITKEYVKRLPYRNIIKITPIKDLKVETYDLLYSDIFDPAQKKVISFAGNLHLIYTTIEASKKLAEWNFKVQDKVDINNDYVILGKDYKDSENYRIAKELNIKLLREKDFYDFLELQYRY